MGSQENYSPMDDGESSPREGLYGKSEGFDPGGQEGRAATAREHFETISQEWILDPTEVNVPEPEDQAVMLETLESMLRSSPKAEERLAMLEGILHDMAWATKKGVMAYHSAANIAEPPTEEPRVRLFSDEDDIVFIGIRQVIGAEVLRDDMTVDDEGLRVYKGNLAGEPLYIVQRFVGEGEDGGVAFIVDEDEARGFLSEMSATDMEEAELAGIQLLCDEDGKAALTRVHLKEIFTGKPNDSV